MSSLLHNLMTLAMGLLVLAAPALCVCTEKPAARQETTHQCCATKQAPSQDDQDSNHSSTCTHCGAQTVRPTADQMPSLTLMLPIDMLPIEIGLLLQPEVIGACIASSQDPPGNPTPVVLHTCSLT